MLILVVASGVRAHPVQFAVARLVEGAGGRVAVSFEYSGTEEEPIGGDLRVSGCPPIGERVVDRTARGESARWVLDCGARGLAGREVELVGARGVSLMVDAMRRDGSRVRELVAGERPRLVIASSQPSEGSRESESEVVLARYVRLGVEHILLGVDHLAFVVCLMLLHRRRDEERRTAWARRLAITLTAFTLGHSVTLALASLGLVHVPPAPVEATIALSIVLLAAEVLRGARAERGREGLAWRRPWIVASAFGLLHGLGFAGALSEVGLPEGDVPIALLGFNVGVEIGQLAFVACVLGFAFAIGAVIGPRASMRERGLRLVAYAIGAVAVSWCIERVTAFWI